jgi:hypothetical protein
MTKKMGNDIFKSDPRKVKVETGENDFIQRTYMIRKKYVDLIDRVAYWDRREKQSVLDEALEAYFKDKKVKPIPDKV